MTRIGFRVTPTRNLTRIAASGLEPRHGARSRRARERGPAVHLFPAVEDPIGATDNRLGDEFGETAAPAHLAVELPDGARLGDAAGYERRVLDVIPASTTTVLRRDLDARSAAEVERLARTAAERRGRDAGRPEPGLRRQAAGAPPHPPKSGVARPRRPSISCLLEGRCP